MTTISDADNSLLRNLREISARQRISSPITDLLEQYFAKADVASLDDVASIAADALGSEQALALIASLPADQRDAILLRTVLGFDAPTAARILGKRPGAVRSAAHRGLKALSKRLGEAP